jgi:REP-associated tyrosine transposase
MRRSLSEVFVHLVWATWDRMPLLTESMRPHVYRSIQSECERMRTELIALGGVDDHVHLLVRLPTSVAMAVLVKQVKGASSHLMNHGIERPLGFRWQGSYSAFSVSKRLVPQVRNYILRQEEHHRHGTVHPHFEPD